MSSEPITPARFAAALQDLPLSSLALKVAELRNSIAHLDYSNEQLTPYAHPTTPGEASDQDCIEAIQENEVVIERMKGRIELVKEEVERRGASWNEVGFMGLSGDEAEVKVNGTGSGPVGEEGSAMMTNGISGEEMSANERSHGMGREGGEGSDGETHRVWTDGTFQTGTISGGRVVMDETSRQGQRAQGGTLGDEELRRRLEERMGDNNADEDGGMHL
jgi:hypothetical protein